MKSQRIFMYYFLCILTVFPITAFADGCNPGSPCYNAGDRDSAFPEVRYDSQTNEEPRAMLQIQADSEAPCEGWATRLAAGSPIWFFQEEDTFVGGGLYMDIYSCCLPVNFRIGAEVNHMSAKQAAALGAAEFPGKLTELTFVRVPLAVEYVFPLAEKTNLFVGGGPDIINTANDVSDTSVGLHLSARLTHDLTRHFGVGLEAGYMWGEVETDQGEDLDLDNTFIIPTLTYTF